MEKTGVQKLAKVLKVLVILLLICNIIALVLVPGVVFARECYRDGTLLQAAWRLMINVPDHQNDFIGLTFPGPFYYVIAWVAVWLEPYMAVLTVFLWVCGLSTAVLLWQAKNVLKTILAGDPFCHSNAKSVKRAALCCFVIAAAALVRTVWSLIYHQSASVLLTYNTFFIPLFLMAGLLCMVISALFRQAAELKEENDLTI